MEDVIFLFIFPELEIQLQENSSFLFAITLVISSFAICETINARAKIFFGITFLGTRLKSAIKPPDGLDGLRPDPLTVRKCESRGTGYGFFLNFRGKVI